MTTSLTPQKQKAQGGATKSPPSTGRRALIVDDERIMQTIGGNMLECLGFHVDTAGDGGSALKCLDTCRYDLVLTDLVMEGIDGVELAHRIRHLSNTTKIVIMTGSKPEQVRDKMTLSKVDRWLFKPFGFPQLREILDQIYADDLDQKSSYENK